MLSISPSYTGRREYFVSENTLAISSLLASLDTASISTRWVSMSSASLSVNSIAFFRSSPSLPSMLPSCWTSSTSIKSSS